MADQIQHKCPNCGGAIEFDSASQKMKCPYCDAEFDPQALVALDAELKSMSSDSMDWQHDAGEWQDGETDGLSVYSCRSCGGEIVADENTGATQCPYCDSPVVLTGRFAGELRPNLVIPFKLDKKAAVESLTRHLTGKKLLPKIFKDTNHIDEVKGVYVPFWLFDADVDAQIRYRGTKVRTWSDSSYNYTQTSFYSIARGGRIGFASVPADGSSKMPDDMMESLEPFDMREAVDFRTAYLAGYLADKYDVSSDECMSRTNERVKTSTADAFASTVSGYTTLSTQQMSVRFSQGVVRYALLPVWLLNTTWNGRKFMFAMNGQTGKFVGDLPCDGGAAALSGFTTTIVSGAAIMALLTAVWYFV